MNIRNFFCFVYLAGPKNFEGLLLRSEVLYRLSHFQSSLADAENAIKSRPTSHKVSTHNIIFFNMIIIHAIVKFPNLETGSLDNN